MSANRTLLSAANRYRELNRSQYWSDEEFRSYTNAHLDQRLRDAVSIRFDAERSGGGSPRAEDLKTLPRYCGAGRFRNVMNRPSLVIRHAFALLGPIVGRKFNLFRSAEGRLFSSGLLFDPIRLNPEIKQFQLVQRAANSYHVRYVADAAISDGTESGIRQEFHQILGAPVAVRFKRVPEIAR